MEEARRRQDLVEFVAFLVLAILLPSPPPVCNQGHGSEEYDNFNNDNLVGGCRERNFRLGGRPLCTFPSPHGGQRRRIVPLCGRHNPHFPYHIGG